MIPDPRPLGDNFLERGSGCPAEAQPPTTADPRPGHHITCVICADTIYLDEYRSARCWTDPTGITCAAHAGCLRRLGENDLHLNGAA